VSLTTPSFTDYVSVVGAAVLARGSTTRGTIDLKSKHGARLFIDIGRGDTTALTNGVDVLIRALANDGTNDLPHPGSIGPLLSSVAAAASTTVNSDSASGQAALNVASSAGWAAGDLACIQDAGGGVTRLEFQRVSKVAAGVLTLDRNLIFTHTGAGADTVRIVDVDEVPLAYLPGSATRVRVKAVGDLEIGRETVAGVH
jgi:hypothetical protein